MMDMIPDHVARFFLILRRALVSFFLSYSMYPLHTRPQIFCCDTYGSRGVAVPFNLTSWWT
jgi:hypothetical protein